MANQEHDPIIEAHASLDQFGESACLLLEGLAWLRDLGRSTPQLTELDKACLV